MHTQLCPLRMLKISIDISVCTLLEQDPEGSYLLQRGVLREAFYNWKCWLQGHLKWFTQWVMVIIKLKADFYCEIFQNKKGNTILKNNILHPLQPPHSLGNKALQVHLKSLCTSSPNVISSLSHKINYYSKFFSYHSNAFVCMLTIHH
jgi:hypothetical protein